MQRYQDVLFDIMSEKEFLKRLPNRTENSFVPQFDDTDGPFRIGKKDCLSRLHLDMWSEVFRGLVISARPMQNQLLRALRDSDRAVPKDVIDLDAVRKLLCVSKTVRANTLRVLRGYTALSVGVSTGNWVHNELPWLLTNQLAAPNRHITKLWMWQTRRPLLDAASAMTPDWHDLMCITDDLLRGLPCLEVLAGSFAPDVEPTTLASLTRLRTLHYDALSAGRTYAYIVGCLTNLEDLAMHDASVPEATIPHRPGASICVLDWLPKLRRFTYSQILKVVGRVSQQLKLYLPSSVLMRLERLSLATASFKLEYTPTNDEPLCCPTLTELSLTKLTNHVNVPDFILCYQATFPNLTHLDMTVSVIPVFWEILLDSASESSLSARLVHLRSADSVWDFSKIKALFPRLRTLVGNPYHFNDTRALCDMPTLKTLQMAACAYTHFKMETAWRPVPSHIQICRLLE